jgi:hypothetical protein
MVHFTIPKSWTNFEVHTEYGVMKIEKPLGMDLSLEVSGETGSAATRDRFGALLDRIFFPAPARRVKTIADVSK